MTRSQKYAMDKIQSLQEVMLEKWRNSCKAMRLAHSLKPYENYLNIGWKPRLKSEVMKLLDENIGRTLLEIMVAIFFFQCVSKGKWNKKKNA